MVPYNHDQKELDHEKELNQTDEQTIIFESDQEVFRHGMIAKVLEINSGDLSVVHQEAKDSHQENAIDDHILRFISMRLPDDFTEKKFLKHFNGFNERDPQKGRPLFVIIDDVWEFLSLSHMVAAKKFIEKMLEQHYEDFFLQRNGSEKSDFENRYEPLVRLMSAEITHILKRETEKDENKQVVPLE